jgi:hypothetical protein
MAKKKAVPPPPPPVVFISSTYRDLREYRATVQDALRKSGYPVEGMELLPASPKPPLSSCISMLAKSNIYVGIIGTLYGSLPPGRKKSYTQLEYEHASQKMKIPCLIFVTSDKYLARVDHIENDAANRVRLENFRNQLLAKHTVMQFAERFELAVNVLISLKVLA